MMTQPENFLRNDGMSGAVTTSDTPEKGRQLQRGNEAKRRMKEKA